jgi:glycogen debranching enzyme
MNDQLTLTKAEAEFAPGNYHIEATESLVERTLRTLKHDDLFAVFDQQGNLSPGSSGPDGLYFRDTRFLSRLKLTVGGADPLQLGSVLLDDNGAMVVDLTNADLHGPGGEVRLQRDSVHIQRFKFLRSTAAYERIRLRSFNGVRARLSIKLEFGADFADLFEVRGEHRKRRGTLMVERLPPDKILFRYNGLDRIERQTLIHFEPAPARLTERSAEWDIDLGADDAHSVIVKICCALDGDDFCDDTVVRAFRSAAARRREQHRGRVDIVSSNPLFNEVLARSWSDMDMLVTETPWGAYPYAGVPWYSTIFGRDGIITAMQMLWCAPYLAKGVLKTLAALQATEIDAAADAQPGKILHEMRGGEMAILGEVPFRRYYGTVDATPLFVMLAAQYHERTGDRETIDAIWPNIISALEWIDRYGDADGDGFVEYAAMTHQGLSNQGWKDSHDSIFHADGRLAEGPIALVEVQAYVFAAKQGAARLAAVLGDRAMARRLKEEAERLRSAFEDAFWVEPIGTYALALDGKKKPCAVRSSNAGHALFCGIAAPDRAARVATQLMSSAFFSGWGIRTIAAGEARFNPMSYHNGSVWPHDNALAALGFARYGLKDEVRTLFQGMFDAATYDDLRRLPELFCGFRRRRRQGPTGYPVACSPQAWAAATPFALVGAAIGLQLAIGEDVKLFEPVLPRSLESLSVRNLRIDQSSLDLQFASIGSDVTTAVLRREGDVAVQIVK